ncbi:hypothetical protein Q73_01870 [Bacillus coahuilensis m2-6]|uniref:hypothetical protein n=1 Tax=Bacillus coahuilensis TaxID=408580 RepID=UPI0007503C05|nr:hypothetical protein [Bacillus coahuilensis]KUP09707.1 hypothetical protein Q73_01870 [Bacillus coahuilensis m2-6]
MNEEQRIEFEQMVGHRISLTEELKQYWEAYSGFNSWGFWASVLMLVIPLLVLFFLIDRKRIFEIGFFGFSMHTIAVFLDSLGVKDGLWGYPFLISPVAPSNVTLDTSLIPVVFMLIYQYTYHRPILFYLVSIGTTLVFSFILKPFLEAIDLFWLSPDFSNVKLWYYYLIAFAFSVIVVKVFHKMSKSVD